MSIDGGASQRRHGETATLPHLAPGLHTLSLVGTQAGRAVQAETTATVVAGTAVDIELTLT